MKKILIIDDRELFLTGEGVKPFFPDADIRAVKTYYEAEDLYDKGFFPDVVFTDCFDVANYNSKFGMENADNTVKWFIKTGRQSDMPIFLFKSADASMATEALEFVLDRYKNTSEFYAVDTDELLLADQLHKGEENPSNRNARTTGFRQFLSRHCGITLPMNDEEIDNYLLSHGGINLMPETIVDLVGKGRLDRDFAIWVLGKKAIEFSQKRFKASVRIFDRPDYEAIAHLSSTFSQAVGLPVNGYAAFNRAQVVALADEGKKPVLFLSEYTTSFIPYLHKLSGIVLLDTGLSGHMKILLAAHGVTGALGASDVYEQFPFVHAPDGRPIRNTKRIHEQDQGLTFDDFEFSLSVECNRHFEEHLPDGWQTEDELKSIPPLVIDPQTLNRSPVIQYGDRVTLVTDVNYQAEVWPMHLDIEEGRLQGIYRWTEEIGYWLDDWHKERGLDNLKFKSNIDIPEQMLRSCRDIGLLRTEHFILASESQQEAFKKSVLNQHNESFEDLRHALCGDLIDILYPCHPEIGVRIRLADMPPAEIFTNSELNYFESQYGDKNLRGVQLARVLPRLYEVQIRGIFDAVTIGQQIEQEHWGAERLMEHAKPQILVPTVENVDEVIFVKDMVSRIAREYGLSSSDYSFGSMMETKKACENIGDIVEHCDFISIGSNDLTEQVLGIQRHDYAARHDAMISHRRDKDPFLTLYGPVIQVIADAVQRLREVKPDIEISLCGAHAEDLDSLVNLRSIKLNSISVTPTDVNLRTLPLAYKYTTFTTHNHLNPSPAQFPQKISNLPS